jgi:hypothetical protein
MHPAPIHPPTHRARGLKFLLRRAFRALGDYRDAVLLKAYYEVCPAGAGWHTLDTACPPSLSPSRSPTPQHVQPTSVSACAVTPSPLVQQNAQDFRLQHLRSRVLATWRARAAHYARDRWVTRFQGWDMCDWGTHGVGSGRVLGVERCTAQRDGPSNAPGRGLAASDARELTVHWISNGGV